MAHPAHPIQPETTLILHHLLDANQHFALSCKGTTNHCPMALIALAEMGADGPRLQAFFDYWQASFAIMAQPGDEVISRLDWRQQLGNFEQFHALQACFLNWLRDEGVDAVLQEVINQIPFAPATGAFHGLIRLAYGLHVAHLGEIAAGLANLVVGYLPVPEAVGPAASDPAQALAHLSTQMGGRKYTEVSITGKVRTVASEPEFTAALMPVPYNADLLPQLAQLAMAAYWQTRDFTVLHMVTACHAARILLARLPAFMHPHLLPPLWSGVAAAYVSVGAPTLLPPEQLLAQIDAAAPQDWDDICVRARASNNDHVIKLCYSCQQENLAAPSPMYYAIARRMLAVRD